MCLLKGKTFLIKWNYYISFYCTLWMESRSPFPPTDLVARMLSAEFGGSVRATYSSQIISASPNRCLPGCLFLNCVLSYPQFKHHKWSLCCAKTLTSKSWEIWVLFLALPIGSVLPWARHPLGLDFLICEPQDWAVCVSRACLSQHPQGLWLTVQNPRPLAWMAGGGWNLYL